MNDSFLHYYEDELRHVREMAAEFGALHPLVCNPPSDLGRFAIDLGNRALF